jgi:hypothetical protein
LLKKEGSKKWANEETAMAAIAIKTNLKCIVKCEVKLLKVTSTVELEIGK